MSYDLGSRHHVCATDFWCSEKDLDLEREGFQDVGAMPERSMVPKTQPGTATFRRRTWSFFHAYVEGQASSFARYLVVRPAKWQVAADCWACAWPAVSTWTGLAAFRAALRPTTPRRRAAEASAACLLCYPSQGTSCLVALWYLLELGLREVVKYHLK